MDQDSREKKIKKPAAMIQTNVKELSLTQRKMINFLIFIAQKEGNRETYTTEIKTLKGLCNIGKTENQELKQQIKELSDIKVEFNILNKDRGNIWEIMNLLSAVRWYSDDGTVEFEIPRMLKEKILNPGIYTPLNILLIAGLSSKYSIILYELLRDYAKSPSFPKITLEQLRKLFGIEDGKYTFFKDFKKWVLDRSVNEINEKTDIECSYDLIKERGNCYAHIIFSVKIKEKKPDYFHEITAGPRLLQENTTKQRSVVVKELTEGQKRLAQELFESIGVKMDKALSVVEIHAEEKIRQALNYTMMMKRNNPAGFFLDSITKEYVLPVQQTMVKSAKQYPEEMLRQEALKCYPSGQVGSCGAEYQSNPGHACYWCPKWSSKRKQA